MKIRLGKNEYSLEIPTLRKWVEIEDLRSKLEIATDNRTFISHYFGLVSVAINISPEYLHDIEWEDVAMVYMQIVQNQKPTLDFPMFHVQAKDDVNEWKYDGRSWYSWAHILAKEYGWDLEYIANLSINDAIGLLHEIVANDYSEREWEWGLSEIAYPYDPNTKKSTYKPLPKPNWMIASVMEKKVKIKRIKIRKDMLPKGMVVAWKENENAEHGESIDAVQSSGETHSE